MPSLAQWGFEFHANGLCATRAVGVEEWKNAGMLLWLYGRQLGQRVRAYQLAMGDWLVLGEKLFGEEFVQYASEVIDIEPKTAQDYMFVARAIPASLRDDRLDFSHFRAVAYGCDSEAERAEWLQRAADGRLKVRELRAAMNDHADDEELPMRCPNCRAKLVVRGDELVRWRKGG